MARKLPYFPFFVGDWVKDTRMLSLPTRAIWMDMLCLMHDGDRRGHLSRHGTPLTPEQIAAFCGCSAAEVTRAVQELVDSGVSTCTETGVLISRRMVRDERKRRLCSEAGKKGGGNPTFKGQCKGGHKLPLVMDMDSGNGSDLDLPGKEKRGGAGGEGEGFAAFWAAYPRKQAKQEARKAWHKLRPGPELLDEMLVALEHQKATEQWLKGFIPHPATWLNGRRWEDEAGSKHTGLDDFEAKGRQPYDPL